MKNLYTILIVLNVLLFAGCVVDEGPVGPAGPAGPEGPQGPAGESAYVFEFEGINFTAPEYEAFLDYPSNFEGLNTDVALVYLLWGVENIGGVDTDIWRPLPQSVFLTNGLLVYNYDFTKNDVRLFLTADFQLDLLTANDTDEWIARVVIVPGNFWSSGRMERSIPFNDLMKMIEAHNLAFHHQKIKSNQ